MAQDEWAQVREDFDATMRKGLTEQNLASAWRSVVLTKGRYKSRGEPVQLGRRGQPTAGSRLERPARRREVHGRSAARGEPPCSGGSGDDDTWAYRRDPSLRRP